MTDIVYKNLARHLDKLPGGFPPTPSGVELRILQRLFTPEEAELAMHLTLIAERIRVIARRAGLSTEETTRRLEEMANKGLIYSIHRKGKAPEYMAAQYVIGIWEYHVNDLNRELVRDMEEYAPTLFNYAAWKKTPQLRTIPIGASINNKSQVLSYERAEELVKEQKRFLVAPCICRRERRMVGEGCDKPEETCLIFGMAADYYHRNGIGRMIDLQASLEILKKADEAGLVLQPGNSQTILNICCCCGCCCGVLRQIKLQPKPTSLVSSPFVAAIDLATCAGCGTCIERCQMDALQLKDERVTLNLDRCIGCGLCVSTCPTESIRLQRKPEAEQPYVPKNIVEASVRMIQARGRFRLATLALMMLRSKLDRLLAR